MFSLFFAAWSSALSTQTFANKALNWPASLFSALQSLSEHTPARPGDRTLVDALQPFVHSLGQGHDLKEAARKAEEGAERTRRMKAKLGRAAYIGIDWEKEEDLPPDPGAWGVAAMVGGFQRGLHS